MPRLPRALFIVALVVYLGTGIVIVQPNETAVVRRFGRALEPLSPGLHVDFPWGLARIDRVRVDEPRSLLIGASNVSLDAEDRLEEIEEQSTGRFLTGDHNVVHLGVTVQYVVRDARRFLYGADDVKRQLAAAAESLISRLVATARIDDILLSPRAALEAEASLAAQLQRRMVERMDPGIDVRSVEFTLVAPPGEVAGAFHDVDKVKSDRQRMIHEAEALAARIERETAAKANQIDDHAIAEGEGIRLQALSQRARFEGLLAAYRQSSDRQGVRRRIFLERMQTVLPRTRIVLVDPQNQGPLDLTILEEGP